MTIYFVTRHSGAVEWAAIQGIKAERVTHLDVEKTVNPGDTVLGTLPVSVVAQVCAKGGHYFHLDVNTPQSERGRELTADEMEEYGAKLEEYVVRKIEK